MLAKSLKLIFVDVPLYFLDLNDEPVINRLSRTGGNFLSLEKAFNDNFILIAKNWKEIQVGNG